MPYLALDLDRTAITTPEDEPTIDAAHSLSLETYKGSMGPYSFDFKIINPQELAALIEKVCIDYDGIIILTSGCWDSSITQTLADNLTLSEQAYNKFILSRFHSAITDAPLFKQHYGLVQDLDKNRRLTTIRRHYPELRNKFITLLDDNEKHITSCNNSVKTLPVLATTSINNKDFYVEAINAMKQCFKREKTFCDLDSKIRNIGKMCLKSTVFFNPVTVQNVENPLLAMDVEGLVALNQ